jgi:predicted lactoylglutathione lyase
MINRIVAQTNAINNNSGYLEYGDKIVTQTKFTIIANKFAPIYAETTIQPTTSCQVVIGTLSTTSSEDIRDKFQTPQKKKRNVYKTPLKYQAPSAPSLDDLDNNVL